MRHGRSSLPPSAAWCRSALPESWLDEVAVPGSGGSPAKERHRPGADGASLPLIAPDKCRAARLDFMATVCISPPPPPALSRLSSPLQPPHLPNHSSQPPLLPPSPMADAAVAEAVGRGLESYLSAHLGASATSEVEAYAAG